GASATPSAAAPSRSARQTSTVPPVRTMRGKVARMAALVAARDHQHALRYAVRVRSVLPSILLLAMALPGRPAAASPPAAAPRGADQRLGGELVRVDLTHRSVTVKTEGHDPREVEG